MSYYQADYYRNPVPYTSSDVSAPVPGWGSQLSIAGPSRVGIGAAMAARRPTMSARQQTAYQTTSRPALTTVSHAAILQQALDRQQGGLYTEGGITSGGTTNGGAVPDAGAGAEGSFLDSIPWWAWPIGAAVLMGGIGYLGVQQGWL